MRWAAILLVNVLVMGFAPARPQSSTDGEAEPLVIAVTYFDNHSGDATYDALGRGLADMLITDLSVLAGVTVVERARLNDLLAELELARGEFIDSATAARIGMGLGARYVLTGSMTTVAPQMRIDARLIRVEGGEVAQAWSVEGRAEEFFLLEKELGITIVDTLQVQASPRESARMGRVETESFDAFVEWSRGLDALDRGAMEEAQRALEAALGHDSGFGQAQRALEAMGQRIDELDQARSDARAAGGQTLLAILDAALATAVEGTHPDALMPALLDFSTAHRLHQDASRVLVISGRVLDLELDESVTLDGSAEGRSTNEWALGSYAVSCYHLGRWTEFLTYGEEYLERYPTAVNFEQISALLKQVIELMAQEEAADEIIPGLELEARAHEIRSRCSRAPGYANRLAACREWAEVLPAEALDERQADAQYVLRDWAEAAVDLGDIGEVDHVVWLLTGLPDSDALLDSIADDRERAVSRNEKADKRAAALVELKYSHQIRSLAEDLRSAGQYEEGREAVQRGFERWPADDDLHALHLDLALRAQDVAWAEEALGRWNDAILDGATVPQDAAEKVAAMRDKHAQFEVQMSAARVEFLAQQLQGAKLHRAAAKAYLELAHEHAEGYARGPDWALHWAGTNYAIVRDLAGARAAFEELLERYPDSAAYGPAAVALDQLPR